MGGVGKTALALVLADRLKARYPDAQLFLNLRGADPDHRPPVPPADVMASVIHAFHPAARLPDTVEALAPSYHSVLAEAGRVLLLLDNAAGADQVRPLLPPGNCLLLVTSRAQFVLPGLAVRNLDCLPPAQSQELLRKLSPRFDGHAVAAAELCGHLPLALEVFAGAANDKSLTPVPELLDRFRARQEELGPVDAAFQVSYELLGEELRRCWRLLGVFPASFDLRAAAAVWGGDSAREAMQALVNASLVEFNQGNGRFRLHDLVRQFCEAKLREADAAAVLTSELRPLTSELAARLRHAAHYRDVGNEAEQLYLKGNEHMLRGLELFDRERVHLEAAFEFLAGCLPESRVAQSVPAASQGSVSLPGPTPGGTPGEPAGEDACATAPAEVRATLLVSLVNAAVYTGDLRFHPRQRIRWLAVQRDAARLAKDRQAEGWALGNLGSAFFSLGDARKAIEFHELTLVIDREIGDRRGEGAALGNLGNAYFSLGNVRKSVEFYEQCLELHREIGDRRGEGADLGNLGIAYRNLGDAGKAIEFCEQYLAIAREIGDRRGEGNALGGLGLAYADLGDARQAIEFYEQHRDVAREIGDRRGEGAALGNLGIAYRSLGDAGKAIEFYEQQLRIVREIGDRRGEGTALWNAALALDSLGDRAQALARAEAALQIFEAIEDPSAAKVRAQLAQWRAAK